MVQLDEVEVCELKPKMLTKDEGVPIHYQSRTDGWQRFILQDICLWGSRVLSNTCREMKALDCLWTTGNQVDKGQ